jgi:ubiquinone/menaquinone biosynthesis C-methylase UbiE
MVDRVPLTQEPIAEMSAVLEYDKGARLYIMPEYKYFVCKVLRKGVKIGRVLDVGTGSGRLAIELAKTRNTDFDIVGLDISMNMLFQARENAKKAGVQNRIDFVLGTASNLPFPEKSFELVISYASLHHWFDPVAVFKEAQRVCSKGGLIVIRDNMRVYGNPLWEAFIWSISRFMNKRHRDNWPKAILASYTLPEIKAILKKSGLENFRVDSDFVRFDICIEAGHVAPQFGSGYRLQQGLDDDFGIRR